MFTGAKRISIPAADPDLRRYMEWHGYVLEHGTPKTFIMRRDLPSGVLCYFDRERVVRFPEPRLPPSIAKVQVLG